MDDCSDLSSDHIQRDQMHCGHADGILSSDSRDRTRAKNSKRLEGLDVSLDPSTTSAVAAGDGESDGSVEVGHGATLGKGEWGVD